MEWWGTGIIGGCDIELEKDVGAIKSNILLYVTPPPDVFKVLL